MAFGRFAHHVTAAWEVPRDLLLGRYPPFVTGGALPRGHIPVFVFHSLEPQSFGHKLDYLAANHYVTLSGAEYFEILLGRLPAPERAVLLSFDDGRGSLWSVAYPLLRRRGMRGMVFLVPGRIRSRAPGPTWDDVAGDAAAEAGLLAREQGEGAFLSWEEVCLLAKSGVLEFHSHTQSHARIHTAAEVVGFLTPQMRHGVDAMDVPLIHSGNRDLFAEEAPLGTPLLRAEARTSEALRYFEEPTFRAACVERVAAEGGARFFEGKDWLPRLRQLVGGRAAPGRYETPDEREQAIRRELEDAREGIEERTGLPAHHLCFPWHVAGPTARRVAREVGYRSAFCGKVPGVPITLPGGDLQAIARIGEDYLERLPGAGRLDLLHVLRRKWTRRLRTGVVP